MDRLPIYEIEEALVAAAATTRRFLVTAPTGSGKSTQVPQMLLRHGLLDRRQVVVLQPRRLPTRLLAARVARELGVPLGREVGYQIRFDNVTSPETRIRFVTEGLLLRQMLDDPRLDNVAALIFDEFHERHLYGDLTLARALDLQEQTRPDLRLFVMSATLDVEVLGPYLRRSGTSDPAAAQPQTREPVECRVLSAAGRTFPVEVRYAAESSYVNRTPVWEQAAEAWAEYVRDGGPGDALIFMPGAYEIHQTLESLRHQPESKGVMLLPLHGELGSADQDAAVARYDRRKVVVATNVAETSLTIDGVRLVVDSGLARIPRHDPYRGINTLLIEKISRASADQRAGRAGRTAPGLCVRLWSECEHADRAVQDQPEVRRLDLAEVVLTLKAAGVTDLKRFRWLEPPGDQALAHAEELLMDLGALKASPAPAPATSHLEITTLGRRMLAFPLHPRYARLLLAAQQYGCVRQAALIAALTQGRDLLLRQVDRATQGQRDDLLGDKAASDFFLLMRAWTYAARHDFRLEACRRLGIHALTARQVAPILDQFLRIAADQGLDVRPDPVPDAVLQKCILVAFSDRVARRLDTGTLRCELVHGRRGVLARESAVQQSSVLVAAEVREIGQHGGDTNTILSLATAAEVAWLQELFPDDFTRETEVAYEGSSRRVCAEEQRRFRGIVLERRRLDAPPLEAAARLLAEEVMAGRLALTDWDHGVEQWVLRLNRLCAWCPEFELPALTEENRRHLIEQVCHGAVSFKEIKDRPVKTTVHAWLNALQRDLLDQHAPERIPLRNGRTPKVTYLADGFPFIAVRIQELYDVTETPRIALGRAPVLVHILAPNMRPVQITQDLAGFWREHYPRVKQELQRRYPKHVWR